MAINAFTIWLITTANIIKASCAGLTIIVCLVLIFLIFNILGNSAIAIARDKLIKFCKCLALAAAILFSINIFIPNSKTLAAMYLIPAIINNEPTTNLNEDVISVLETLTEQWKKELVGKSD